MGCVVRCELVIRNNASVQWAEDLRCPAYSTQLSQFSGGIQRTRQLLTASQRRIGLRIAVSGDICQTQSEWGAKPDYVRLYAITLQTVVRRPN